MTQNKTVSLFAAVLVASFSAGCGSSDTPADTTGGDTGATDDSTSGDTGGRDSGVRDSAPVDTAPGDSAKPDTAPVDSAKDSSGDTTVDGGTDSGSDTLSAETALDSGADTTVDDTAVVDGAVADVLDDTPDAADVLDTADAPLASLGCGPAPLHTVALGVLSVAATPLTMDVTSSACTAGESVSVVMTPDGSGSAGGRAAVVLGEVAQFLTATSVDDTTFPGHSFEFIPNDSYTATKPFYLLTNGRRLVTLGIAPPGFDGTTGTAYIEIILSKKSSSTAPCNSDGGVTFALDSASATAHPEALVYYDNGSGGWLTTGGTVAGNGAAVILTPLAGATPDYVTVIGTKAGCTIDTGTNPTGPGRTLAGMTGRVPVVPNHGSELPAAVLP